MANRRPLVWVGADNRVKELPTADRLSLTLLEDVATNTLVGRALLGSGVPTALSASTARSVLGFSSTAPSVLGQGLVTAANAAAARALLALDTGDTVTFAALTLTGSLTAAGINGAGGTTSFNIAQPTADGADTARVAVMGGATQSINRGGFLQVHGNEHASAPGIARLTSGTGADLELSAAGASISLDAPLEVNISAGTPPAIAATTVGVFQRNTSTGAVCRISIISGNAATAGVNFGDADSETTGGVLYDHATETMTLRTNGGSSMLVTAAAVTLPATAAAGTNNTTAASTAYAMSAAPNASYRNILDSSGSLTAAQTTGTYAIGQGDPLVKTLVNSVAPPNLIYIDSADYPTVNGLTTKLRVRAIVSCNDVAPGATFVIALHPVTRTSSGGSAGNVAYTVGAAVASSAATTVTTPAADSMTSVVGSDFALPTNGVYALGVVQSTASIAASAHVHFSAQLQMRNT